MSSFLSLNTKDLIKGLITSLIAAVITVFYTVTQTAGFDVFATDWKIVLGNVINVSVITAVAYLAKNLLTNASGDFMAKDSV